MIKRKVYYIEGDWSLVQAEDYAGWKSWITHTCETPNLTEPENLPGSWINGHLEECYYCDLSAPAELVSLWRLHNWDQAQKWEAAGYPV